MLRWKCWGRGDGSGGGDGGDGDCGARSHAACRGGPPWYAGEESSRAGRIFFASSALHRALGERQRFWFWAETRCTFLKRHFIPQEIDPLHQTVSPRATFISFRNVVAAPRYPDGRYAAGYRGAIIYVAACGQRRVFPEGHGRATAHQSMPISGLGWQVSLESDLHARPVCM